jgi:hypothetical protein
MSNLKNNYALMRHTISFRELKGITLFIITIIIIIIIMALQPFVGPWQLFQFLDPIRCR